MSTINATTIKNESASTGITMDANGGIAVDTDTLKVDATNDRVGINTASPTVALDVTGAITASGTITANSFSGDGSSLTGTGPTVFKSAEFAYADAGAYYHQVEHNQGTPADHVSMQLIIKAADDGYSVGDIIDLGTSDMESYTRRTFYSDSTHLGISYQNKAYTFQRLGSKEPTTSSNSVGNFTNSAHRYRFIAIWY